MRLHRLMSYICSFLDMKLYGWVGDKAESLRLDLFVDADLAGEIQSCKAPRVYSLQSVVPTRDGPLLGSRRNSLLLRIVRLSPKLLHTVTVCGR